MSVTGEIPGTYENQPMPEQGLVIRTGEGIHLITGCSHPGIVTMAEKVMIQEKTSPLLTVLGGFHMMDLDGKRIRDIGGRLKSMGVIQAGPTHCSGELTEQMFRQMFEDGFIRSAAGQEIDL